MNTNFFSRKSLNACYWAGFIAADGNLRYLDRKEIRLSCNKQDTDQLERKWNKV